MGTKKKIDAPKPLLMEQAYCKRGITRPQLALEFNRRYGIDLKKRVAKLKEEVKEMAEALDNMTDWKQIRNEQEIVDDVEAFRNEVRDAASVMNQIEHLILNPHWPQEVHDLLEERDRNPDAGRTHEHVRNVEAGE